MWQQLGQALVSLAYHRDELNRWPLFSTSQTASHQYRTWQARLMSTPSIRQQLELLRRLQPAAFQHRSPASSNPVPNRYQPVPNPYQPVRDPYQPVRDPYQPVRDQLSMLPSRSVPQSVPSGETVAEWHACVYEGIRFGQCHGSVVDWGMRGAVWLVREIYQADRGVAKSMAQPGSDVERFGTPNWTRVSRTSCALRPRASQCASTVR